MTGVVHKALLVGNRRFDRDQHNLPTLKGPSNDVTALRKALTHPELGLYSENNVTVLLDEGYSKIIRTIENFILTAKPDDQLLFYYSGHGFTDLNGNLFLCAADTETSYLTSSAIGDFVINRMIELSHSRRFCLIIDSCYSGSFKGMGAAPSAFAGAGRFVISSAQNRQLANDAANADECSPFTNELVNALTSEALDHDHDGIVMLSEIYDSVFSGMRKRTAQIPQRSFDKAIGDLPMARRLPPRLAVSTIDNAREHATPPEIPSGQASDLMPVKQLPRREEPKPAAQASPLRVGEHPHNRWKILVGLLSVFAVVSLYRQLIQVYLPLKGLEYNLITLAHTVLGICFFAGSILIALVSDRFGSRTWLPVSVFVCTLTVAVSYLFSGLPVVVGCFAMYGFASAVAIPTAMRVIVGSIMSNHRGKMAAVIWPFSSLGILASTWFGPLMYTELKNPTTSLACCSLGIIAATLAYFLIRPEETKETDNSEIDPSGKSKYFSVKALTFVIQNSQARGLLVAYIFAELAWSLFSYWQFIFFVQKLGRSHLQLSTLTSTVTILVMISLVGFGAFSDRMVISLGMPSRKSRQNLLIGSAAFAALAFFIFPFVLNYPLSVALFFLVQLAVFAWRVFTPLLVAELATRTAIRSSVALLCGCGAAIGVFGAKLLNTFSVDSLSWVAVVSGILTAAATIVLIKTRSYPKAL